MELAPKVVVVTGAGQGLGRAYALALAAAGARVVVNDMDNAAAEEAVDEIRQSGGQAVAEVAEVGSAAAADALVDRAVAEWGRLDVMVTNAGALRDRTLAKMSDEDFDVVVDSHLRGTFTCGRAAVRRFAEQGEGGRLVLVASPAAFFGNFGRTAYGAAKAGIVSLTRVWAVECQRLDVTVNAIIPMALTAMAAKIPGMADLVEAVQGGAPVPVEHRRAGLGSVDDVAPLVTYLASDASADVTGQAIGVGGDRLSLWAHPREVATASREGGWDADALADAFGSVLGPHLQPFASPRPLTRPARSGEGTGT